MPAASSNMVTLRGVTRRYGPVETGVVAAKDIDLDIARGEFVSFVGPSGGGKTTLLKMVAGLIEPTAGSITVDGMKVHGEPPPGIGMVFQAPVLLPWRSALENVMLPADILKLPKKEARQRATELLESVGLGSFVDHPVDALSGGMQQRVAICRALLHDPAILLMDEPFGALDEMTREGLNDQLLELWEQDHKTVLFVTHGIDEAVYLSDRVVVLSTRPSVIRKIEKIELGRPRHGSMRTSPEFAEYVKDIRGALGLAV